MLHYCREFYSYIFCDQPLCKQQEFKATAAISGWLILIVERIRAN